MSDNELIYRIKTALKQEGISQRELALKLGKKETEISRWLSGRMGISAQNLQRIEEVLGRPLSRESLQKSGNRSIRIGIVGTGSIAGRFASEIAHVQGTYISAAYNPNETQLKLFCDRYGIAIEADSYEMLLNHCDAVYIASPISTHFEYAKAALENNRHVLCEMPFTRTKAEAAELFKMANKRGLTLIPALKTAYCPSFLKLIEIAKSGEIGEIVDISGTVTTLLPSTTSYDKNEEIIRENSTYLILIAFKFFGIHPCSISNYQYRSGDIKVVFAHSVFDYGSSLVSMKIGTGVKSEGSLVISGTSGYLYVPAPWWKTSYFELRRENMVNNQKFYFPFDSDGLRYEISAFVDSITGVKDPEVFISTSETIKMVEYQMRLFK